MSVEPLVSVIMPVHNSEIYLSSTISSLINQKWTNFEIICVDDGSNDGTIGMLREYQVSEPRLRLFHNPVQGAGASRNIGIAKASGKYLLFLDSDDSFHPSLISDLVQKAEKDSLDLVICGYLKKNEHTGSVVRDTLYFPKEQSVGNANSYGKRFLKKVNTAPWNKLIKKQLIIDNGIEFQNTRHANDLYAIASMIIDARRIGFVRPPLLTYRVGSKTSTQQGKDRHPLEILIPIDALLTRYGNIGEEWKIKYVCYLAARNLTYSIESMVSIDSRKQLWTELHDSQSLLYHIYDYLSHAHYKRMLRAISRYSYDEYISRCQTIFHIIENSNIPYAQRHMYEIASYII